MILAILCSLFFAFLFVAFPTYKVASFYGKRCRKDVFFEDVVVFMTLFAGDAGIDALFFQNFKLVMPCYRELVVLVRDEDEAVVKVVVPEDARMVVVSFPNYFLKHDLGKRKYFFQQYLKFKADTFLDDINVKILFMESDAPSYRALDRDCFTIGDKIHFYASNDLHMWLKGTEWSLKRKLDWHYVVMYTPVLLHASTVRNTRRFVEKAHGKSFDRLVKDVYLPQFQWNPDNLMFSEFNTIVSYALLFEDSRYSWSILKDSLSNKNNSRHWLDKNFCGVHLTEFRDGGSKYNPVFFEAFMNITTRAGCFSLEKEKECPKKIIPNFCFTQFRERYIKDSIHTAKAHGGWIGRLDCARSFEEMF